MEESDWSSDVCSSDLINVDSAASPETDLAFQPGGGVDVSLASKWAVRIQGDFRAIRVSSTSTTTKQERVVAGFVFRP